MNAEEQFWLVVTLVVIGSYGWGHATLRVLDLGRSDNLLRREASVPFVVCTGIALFLSVGGFAVAAGVAYFSVLAGWFLLGTALGVAPLSRALNRARHWQPTPRAAFGGAVAAIVIALVVALAYGAAISGPTNPNDDAAAYLYLAERLLRTGGMVDPFNFRRITSYNSGELFQAIFLRAAGTSVGLAVEWFLFGLLTAALFVGRAGRRFALPALLAAGVVVAVVHPVGATVNIAPTFSGVALTFALLQLLAVPAERHDARRYLLAGLFVGALLSLRYAFAIPATIVVITVPLVLVKPRRAILRVGVAAVVACGAVAGWAVALDLSSGTPLFPIFSGNATTTSRWRDPHVQTLAGYLGRVRGEIVTDGWGLEMLAVLVAAGLVVRSSRRRGEDPSTRPASAVLLSVGVGCAVLLGVTTFELSGGSYSGIGRYNAPSALAAMLFGIDLLWQSALAEPVRSRRAPGHAAVALSSLAIVIGATPTSAGAFAATPPLARFLKMTRADLSDAGEIVLGHRGFADQWSPYRNRYQAISNDVPFGSHILAAVDLPALLDFSRFQFATLDEVGAASPPPGLPLRQGAQAIVSYLEQLGYSGIVASDTEAVGLYSYGQWASDSSSGVWDYRVLAEDFGAWSKVLGQLSHDKQLHVSRVPTLVYYGFPDPGASDPRPIAPPDHWGAMH